MTDAGLSYEQAPPFAAPLRFFLIAPLFLLLAAGLALFLPDWQSNRWSPAALALTHLISLGYLAMVMLGALLQILPVVLGAPVPAVRLVSWLSLLGVSIGAPSLALGFLLGEPLWLYAGTLTLATGLSPVIVALTFSLIRTAAPQVAWPIRQALFALVVTLSLGITLAGGLAGVLTDLWPLSMFAELTTLHASWGLVGWVLILVIGVAYQVVPMLQITPPYPPQLSRWLTWIMLAGLQLVSTANTTARLLGDVSLVVTSLVFAVATLRIQARRRRKVPDITLDFWRLGMGSLIFAALLFLSLDWLPERWQDAARISLGLAFMLGFATSVVSGMLYKIVPFLAWFHLKTQTGAKVGSIPNMKEMIPDKLMRLHFQLHLAALICLLPAPFLPALVAVPGLLFLAAGALRQWLNLLNARRLFLRFGGRLE